MMKELFVALPSQRLESLLLRRNDTDSHEILCAWTAVYHPEVLRRTRQTAKPFFAEHVFEEPSQRILITPYSSYAMFESHWIARAKERGCVFLTDCANLEKLAESICRELDRENSETEVETGEKSDAGGSLEISETPEAPEKSEISLETSEPAVTADDFLALGMIHFLMELLSRKMHYASTMDDYQFKKRILAAADAFFAEDFSLAKTEMQVAWDQLIQSRQYYAATNGHLFDMTLLAPTILPDSLTGEIKAGRAMNLLADGETARRISEAFPALRDAVKDAISAGTLALLGGEETETPLPLLTQEGILKRLLHGLSVYEKYLGTRPKIFARRSAGLTPMLPGILKDLKFDGAIHATFDDGKFPVPRHTRIRWRGNDGTDLETFAAFPADAKNSGDILSLPEVISGIVRSDVTQGQIFAHWPGEKNVSPWYRLWKRSTRFVPIFGELSTFTGVLKNTPYCSSTETYSADEYVSPFLSRAVSEGQVDPISRWMVYHQARMESEALGSLAGIHRWLTGKKPADARGPEMSGADTLLDEIDRLLPHYSPERFIETKSKIDTLRAWYAEKIGEFLTGNSGKTPPPEKSRSRKKSQPAQKSPPQKNAILVINPWSFSRLETINLSAEEEKMTRLGGRKPIRICPAETDAGILAHIWERSSPPTHAACVSVPPVGFTFLTDSPLGTAFPPEEKKPGWFRRLIISRFSREKPVPPPVFYDAESNTWIMRNEHLELRFDTYTGYLRAVYDNVHRGNRLSQQLGMRLKPAAFNASSDDENEDYTIMAADDFHAKYDAASAELSVSGRLMDRNGELAAKFKQVTTLRRGVPVITFDITLDPVALPGKNAWQSYYANRFVWGDMAADVFRNVGTLAVPCAARKMEAPLFIDIRPIQLGLSTHAVNAVTKTVSQALRRDGSEPTVSPEAERPEEIEYKNTRITLLTNGLPFHRLIGSRQIDNLLIVHGETRRHFRLGVSLGTTYPAQAAADFMTAFVQTPVTWEEDARAQKPRTGWMLHVDRKNVLITHWEPTAKGAIIRLAETQGRRTTAAIRAYRDIRAANRTDFLGNVLNSLKVDAGAAVVELPANGWVQVEVEW